MRIVSFALENNRVFHSCCHGTKAAHLADGPVNESVLKIFWYGDSSHMKR